MIDATVWFLYVHSYELLTAALLALSWLGAGYIVLKAIKGHRGSKWVRRVR